MKDRQLTAVDLFCGCGGISVGLRAAGIKVLAGVDVEPNYMRTFSRNFPNAKSLQLDLSKITPEEFMCLLEAEPGGIDFLTGGPPCQGFSKNVPRKYRYLDDPRNQLINAFLDCCKILKPRFILMENVAEMKNGFDKTYSDEILTCLREEGYTVTYAVLNAADYGVPQRRRRAFFIANREGVQFQLPPRTHSKEDINEYLFPRPKHVTVWEAIGDLPSKSHTEGENEICEYACAPFSDFQRLMRNGSNVVTNHVARPLQPTQYERLASIQPGQGLKDLPAHLRTKGGYSGAYGRLTKDMVAPTITRWVFHPGSGRWGHPVDTRLLTIREIARIQGFPDSYEFEGSYVQRAGQLGNAVPPLLAQRIVESMLDQAGISSVRESNWASNSINFSRPILSSSTGKGKVTT
ncbi:MAG: (cytosine-5)-methyltransferase 1 [Acidobacteriota bacterium]|jgi:DNA (cytosine-5)-methyltransferase 1|nr:(cytosine-5)-methyltransferase 1 [Acidobacteriota bacterium]